MAIRVRQYLEDLVERLFLIPLAFVLTAIALSQVSIEVDRRVENGALPSVLETTVESARSILSTIAAGLISSVTLLLSLTLVAVQLASSQFSPRVLRNWIGDRTLQVTIGTVLGTSVFCLLILRDTRTFGDSSGEGTASSLVPHVSVLVAVVLGVASLVSVVKAVDHLTDSLRIGTVASRIMDATLMVIAEDEVIDAPDNPTVAPASANVAHDDDVEIPDDAVAITCSGSGWVQQIDRDALVRQLPEGSTTWIVASVGTFALPSAPLLWTTGTIADDHVADDLESAFALGSARTMNQDPGYGILRMTDIALRALSPGVNDPNTANDILMHLAVVLLRLWERPTGATIYEAEGRRLVKRPIEHADYLHEAFDPIRRYGSGDPQVAETMIRTLRTLRSETVRRDLPGPKEPIDEMIRRIVESVESSDALEHDKANIRQLVSS